jgi:hypothetical protein
MGLNSVSENYVMNGVNWDVCIQIGMKILGNGGKLKRKNKMREDENGKKE